jgi:predicted dehydrogenase
MPESSFPRRNFLRGVTAATALSYSRVYGANERIQLGLIGCGERGRYDAGNFVKTGNVEVTALCDIWGAQIDKAKLDAPNARTFSDHRALLDNKDIDVALIGTPDHWHVPITIDALNAGKDVFVEKPLSLTIEEGPAAVKAARINNRICQVGMQQRSGKHYIEAKREYIDSGRLGKVTLARTWWYGNGYHLRKAPDYLKTKPQDLDWAHYLGRLKWRDWDPQQYWNWRAYLDFGGGQVTDLFTHWIDVVHMFLGSDVPASAGGGRRRVQLQGRAHGAGHDQRAAGISGAVYGDVRGHAGSGHQRRGAGVRRHPGTAVHRPATLRIPRGGARRGAGWWCRRPAASTWTTWRIFWSA